MRLRNKIASAVLSVILIFSFLSGGVWGAEMSAKQSPAERMWGKTLPLVEKTLNEWDQEFSSITIQDCFNNLYGRESKLDLRTRELCTVMILTCIGKPEELNLHLYAGLNVGWKLDELREVFVLSTIPAGWPCAIDGMRYFHEWCEKNKIPMPPSREMRQDFLTADWYKTGYNKGIQLYGEETWTEYLAGYSSLEPDFAQYVTENFYGKILTRPGLTDKTKELLLTAACAALQDEPNLKLHIAGALNNGATETEIKEILFHVGIYAGQGATSMAINTYQSMEAAKNL